MITTLTWNPSLDYVVTVEDFQLGRTNRTKEEWIAPGGKGINVSLVLKRLGIPTRLLGFTAGFTGNEITKLTKELGLIPEFIDLPTGYSRINVKWKYADSTELNGMGPQIGKQEMEKLTKELGLIPEFIDLPTGYSRINVKWKYADSTELNGMGPQIGKQEMDLLYGKLDELQEKDILVLAGSISRGMTKRAYRDIMDRLSGKQIRFVVDASGELLRETLGARPFLIKPNQHELEDLFGVTIPTIKEAAYYGEKLQEEGAVNVLISMGGQGALLIDEDGNKWYQSAPEGIVVNTVGAGDSMVAGFLSQWLKTGDYKDALRYGTAAGSASAFSEGLAEKEKRKHFQRHDKTGIQRYYGPIVR